MTAAAILLIATAHLAAADVSEIDARRNETRHLLSKRFAHIASSGQSLSRRTAAHDETCGRGDARKTCRSQASALRRHAIELQTQIDAVEDMGRQGWLIPGEVRDARRQAVDDTTWENLERLVTRLRLEPEWITTLKPSAPKGRSGGKRRR